jgi:hypothetical protein
MSSRTVLVAASILAAAIAYAGNQLKGETISQSQSSTESNRVFGVFQASGGSIRYCEGGSNVIVCSSWQ